MLFEQIKKHGDNFSYVIADQETKEACVVDPSFNTDAIISFLKRESLEAKYVIDTHSHSDHTGGNREIAQTFRSKIVTHALAKIQKDISVSDGDTLKIGSISLKVIHTPGHTSDSICILVDGRIITGDTLFVGECGRTDLPGGSPEQMYHSLFDKLMKLDEDIEVYPGHDYGPRPYSTIGIEKRTNYVLEKRTLQEFLKFMATP